MVPDLDPSRMVGRVGAAPGACCWPEVEAGGETIKGATDLDPPRMVGGDGAVPEGDCWAAVGLGKTIEDLEP